jgi:mRNA-degrading endonuclease toxin of MazEF toxin-antitoxin module
MAQELRRGEIWHHAFVGPDKRRPVLILSHSTLIPLLHTVTVAAITSTLRGSLTEVELGEDEGLKHASCVNLCNVFTLRKHDLSHFVGFVTPMKMLAVCRALNVATGCS